MTTAGWQLIGITGGRGSCEHCGRSLARLFRITDPQSVQMVVGRVCSMKLTGYTWSTALAERIEAGRVAEELAAERYGDLWVELKAVAKATAGCRSSQGTAGSAGEGMHGLLKGWISEEQARTLLRDGREWLTGQGVSQH